MSEPQQLPAPRIANPVLAPPLGMGPATLGLGGFLVAALAIGIWSFSKVERQTAAKAPNQISQLSDGFVTPISSGDHANIAAALAVLHLPEAQRLQVKRDVLEGRQRLGWIIFIDSIDPDGDIVAVEAAGLVQHVSLTKAWTAVAVPLSGTPIGITAVRDGAGGGVTVALATRAGPVTLRILLPGERIEVAAP
ncbi:hypothetical protein [Pseudorhodoplanes sp.]|uniref:hypothetical protein n=1 Tax=Pseudorhodoplanes sp. TaxID=1934341 RepID=UPI00391C207A